MFKVWGTYRGYSQPIVQVVGVLDWETASPKFRLWGYWIRVIASPMFRVWGYWKDRGDSQPNVHGLGDCTGVIRFIGGSSLICPRLARDGDVGMVGEVAPSPMP